MISTAFLKCLCIQASFKKLCLKQLGIIYVSGCIPTRAVWSAQNKSGFVWGDVRALSNSGVDQTSKLRSARFASVENPGAVGLMYESKLEKDMNQR